MRVFKNLCQIFKMFRCQNPSLCFLLYGAGLGSNYWNAQGSLLCKSAPGGDCRAALICGPDPIGCSCVAGYTGLDCTTGLYCTKG